MRTLLLALALTAAPAFAQNAAAPNPQIDYPGFEALTASVAPERATRLIAFDAFKAEAAKPGTLLLDARSKDAFQRGHIRGAVNLPLTDFTAESLAAVIGADSGRPILIYCNNNFSNHRSPVPLKSAALALNIQTFINLVGYGYPNVRELADVVDFTDPGVEWVTG
ncbi:MAG: rhodanese-like domain-containing protein [Sphingopyxis sp.]|uniref:rhodanese-like domain-containing protein n=1 Tax=Sphingopyxis sp. TaxID=1908224 RepID=UPI001A26EADF|nr:rhodanese-like domain-containing protein [Sphingopyxis sp.]MBJ7501280.1 rhodanese-like domain-containing protein [Sphingopyxis sp.]